MITEPLVDVHCAVCAGDACAVLCPAAEVQAHQETLRAFHSRRLCPGPSGRPPRAALADRAEFTHDYATDIVACGGCGLIFRNPRPSAEAIARAYEEDHYGRQRLTELFEAQLELYRPKARALRRWLPSRPVVVEVGSFVGGFLAAGREQGWEMRGVDPGEEVNAFCRERSLPVFQGMLAAAPLEPGSVDCIAIWNTFDQLPDPEPTLAAARRLLRPGGVMAVRVPNGDCFRRLTAWNRRLPRPLGGWLRAAMAWNNLLAFPYLHGYSPRTLDWLLGWHGFERIAVHSDTLPRLADAQTKRWAAREERALKALFRLAARVEALGPASTLSLAPWLDTYYRLPPDRRD